MSFYSLKQKKSRERGFTLTEIAIVLLIIGLVAGSMLGPLTKQIERRRINDTQKILEENRDALLGIAVTRGYLPCPAISATDGNEGQRNPTSGACINLRGYLPWTILGTPKSDSWGQLLRYAVSSPFANSSNKLTFSATGDMTIQSSSSPAVNLATTVPIIILSHGPNGIGAIQENGIPIAKTSTTNTDEKTNITSATVTSAKTFVSRVPSEVTDKIKNPGGEFDDIVMWIPTSILFGRMLAAGQLP
jgi:prepilin-type N-terminal cleavage/methylation domain-containing protein